MIDPLTILFVQRRASYPIFLKYGINRFELLFLIQLTAILRNSNKQLIAKKLLFETITRTGKDYPKMQGYYRGCLNKGLIATFEYISKPNSLSVGITDLGLQVIKTFNIELHNYAIKFAARSNELPVSVTVSPPIKHKETSQRITA